jgi:hypothetical protein
VSKRGYPRLVRLGAFVTDEQSAALWVMESGLDGDPSATPTRADDAIDDVSYCGARRAHTHVSKGAISGETAAISEYKL